MKRHELLAAASALALSRSVPAFAQDKSTIRLGIVAVEEGAPAQYAVDKGFYNQAGLDVAVTRFANGAAVAQGVVAGALDVGMTNSGSMSIAHQRQLPLRLIACLGMYSKASPLCHIAVAKGSGIRGAKDLAGKTVAVSAIRDMLNVSVMSWIDANGGDAKTVNYIEIPFPQMAEAVVAKRVDAAAIVEPFYSKARGDLDAIGLNYQAVNDGKPFQTLGLVGNSTWIAANAATVSRLADAVHTSARWANANHDEAARLLAAITSISPDIIDAYPRVLFAESNKAAYVQPVVSLMAQYGVLPAKFDAADLFASGLI